MTHHKSRRPYSIVCFLPTDGGRRKVCKSMFSNTLAIIKDAVDIAMQKRSKENVAAADPRGKGKSLSLDPTLVEGIKDHITSFPCIPSHCFRAGSARKYLDSSLNLASMYRMYRLCESWSAESKIICLLQGIPGHFQSGVPRPEKRQVATDPTGGVKREYEAHLNSKDEDREDKRNDKQIALEILLCPSDPTNDSLFYKRRLATYNFTISNVATKQGDCFIWHEGQGGRGSCEIANYLFLYFQSLPNAIKEVRCFSDRCGGQNLNKLVIAMCMYAVQVIDNVHVIELKFLTPGHSEMECDSMHSAIGTDFKRVGKAFRPGLLQEVPVRRATSHTMYMTFRLMI
ncbi:hypothetical protein PR048_032926 [Dryococelus australis]|uniref:Uncharacterized protein n=1 Tax=Dryococelus australis TaxID=614101 RepID=A0ABQ9G3L8_9NEOP|nr:hypothetical protein PR048_032926 [Dryococelus australis]